MNVPNSMYKMRPIINLAEELDLPKCMYKMNVIQLSHSIDPHHSIQNEKFTPVIVEQKPTKEVVALESRQEAILLQLSHLKQQLCSLREQLKGSNATIMTTVHSPISNKVGFSEEIVVKANPKWPPYSLLALDHVLKNAVNVQCYKHSAFPDLPESLNIFEKKCVSPVFNIRIIWKQVQELEFLVNPTKHSVMQTEVNLLRFLSRSGPMELNYECAADPTVTCLADGLLDSCYKLCKESTLKARLALVREFGELLKMNTFLMGENVSVVDIALWSTLKQIGFMTKNTKDIPLSIYKWFVNCNAIFGVNSQ